MTDDDSRAGGSRPSKPQRPNLVNPAPAESRTLTEQARDADLAVDARALVLRYCTEAGLSPVDAALFGRLCDLRLSGHAFAGTNLYDPEQIGEQRLADPASRLTPVEYREYTEAVALLSCCLHLCEDAGVEMTRAEFAAEYGTGQQDRVVTLDDEDVWLGVRSVTLQAGDVQAAYAVLAARESGATFTHPDNYKHDWVEEIQRGPAATFPSVQRVLPRYLELVARAALTDAEIEDRYQALARMPNGAERPDFLGWFITQREESGTHDTRESYWDLLWFRARAELDRMATEDLEHRAAEIERREEELSRQEAEIKERAAQIDRAERERRRRSPVRQSMGLLRSWAQREDHMLKAERRGKNTTSRSLPAEAAAEQTRLRKEYRHDPLGWAERLTIHGLVGIARELGKLEAHPWALQRRPILTEDPASRVRVLFPGYAELAREVGFETDATGRIPKERTRALERALVALTTRDRWIAQPVSVPVGRRKVGGQWKTEYRDDTHATFDRWVVAGSTAITRHVTLDLHPVAVMSHRAQYIDVGNLAARYDAARRAIGGKQMRDEWAAADDYLRYIASVQVGLARGALRAAVARGDAQAPAAAADEEGNGARMLTIADTQLTKDLDDDTLRHALGLAAVAKKRGGDEAARRLEEALAFAQSMGTLISFARVVGAEGQPMWRLTLAHPNVFVSAQDPAQGLLFLPGSPDEDEA